MSVETSNLPGYPKPRAVVRLAYRALGTSVVKLALYTECPVSEDINGPTYKQHFMRPFKHASPDSFTVGWRRYHSATNDKARLAPFTNKGAVTFVNFVVGKASFAGDRDAVMVLCLTQASYMDLAAYNSGLQMLQQPKREDERICVRRDLCNPPPSKGITCSITLEVYNNSKHTLVFPQNDCAEIIRATGYACREYPAP
ncbi:hypothetical protein M441DRAFT_50394 [Trichoderma asperellum CBS 433.97]|uniref:Uncharacterized protein n=1 Tax=Trichoderma asperellum (strain ATCC 204424 / CBS 433.97 / NBRC 101777) TaxID=1042311 RepID=A0A2T3YX56_TRIA4|nr:hypothetical protein M441DRAFT_50394 [Trichoderma asperellum CBS 433.97]PTB37104.1 hypothetical protein M441DRAFT_50394 [Trichoderma asperellum CBS 433.97]